MSLPFRPHLLRRLLSKASKSSKPATQSTLPLYFSLPTSNLPPRLHTALQTLQTNLAQQVTLQPRVESIDTLTVTLSKTERQTIKELASVVKRGDEYIIHVNDERTTVFIEKAIRNSKLGLSPVAVDNQTIKIQAPRINEETKKGLMRQIATLFDTQKREMLTAKTQEVKNVKGIYSDDANIRSATKTIDAAHADALKKLEAIRKIKETQIKNA